MSNLLLITDVARLQKVFSHLTDDKNVRLRVVNNLEKGGEEIGIEKPDVVFVQTHLSGLSAEILLMHLKKQLGRKRTRFVLLASPDQTSEAILKPYQGWLDTSTEDDRMLSDLRQLLKQLLNKPKKSDDATASQDLSSVVADPLPHPVTGAESAALLGSVPSPVLTEEQQTIVDQQFPVAAAPAPQEPSLEEQGLTYAPRQRLKVYSEFNSNFDSAVSSTPDPEPLKENIPEVTHGWDSADIDTIESRPVRSRKSSFLLWLVPVVVVVVLITYIQQRKPAVKPEASPVKPVVPGVANIPAPGTAAAPAPPAAVPSSSVPAKPPAAAVPAAPASPGVAAQEHDRMSDKAVLSAIAENKGGKTPQPTLSAGARPSELPDFIPRYGLDKSYGEANPGWERYKGKVTEFKVLREGKSIKAIQVIDRGGAGVPESFMKGVLRQVAKAPSFAVDASEKKEGYEIQRGKASDSIRVVYYRDETGGKLRAFVMTWQ